MQAQSLHRRQADPATMLNGAENSPAAPPRASVTSDTAAAQLCRAAVLLAGIWVAVSPWFLTLQSAGDNATAIDLITGLVIAALALFAATGLDRISLHVASALAGAWVIVLPFILTAKFPITGAMYWSNSWAGGVIVVLALGALIMGRRRAVR